MGDNTFPRIPHMIQVAARACHEAGHPPPPGLKFDEESGTYVVGPEHPAMMADPPKDPSANEADGTETE